MSLIKSFTRMTWILIGFVLVVLLIFFAPYRIAKDPMQISGITIEYQGQWLNSFNEDEVRSLLSTVRCRRTIGRTILFRDSIEINFLYDKSPVHIMLGDSNLLYHAGDDFQMYVILDFEQLLSQFEKLLPSSASK